AIGRTAHRADEARRPVFSGRPAILAIRDRRGGRRSRLAAPRAAEPRSRQGGGPNAPRGAVATDTQRGGLLPAPRPRPTQGPPGSQPRRGGAASWGGRLPATASSK